VGPSTRSDGMSILIRLMKGIRHFVDAFLIIAVHEECGSFFPDKPPEMAVTWTTVIGNSNTILASRHYASDLGLGRGLATGRRCDSVGGGETFYSAKFAVQPIV